MSEDRSASRWNRETTCYTKQSVCLLCDLHDVSTPLPEPSSGVKCVCLGSLVCFIVRKDYDGAVMVHLLELSKLWLDILKK